MVTLINAYTGSEMQVDESRVEEYLKLGHKTAEVTETAKPAAKKTARKTTKKTTAKE